MSYGVHICCLAEAEGSAKVRGRIWRWEFHHYLGPMFVDKHGNGIGFPPENHPVWDEFNHWLWQHHTAKKDKKALAAMGAWYTPRNADNEPDR